MTAVTDMAADLAVRYLQNNSPRRMRRGEKPTQVGVSRMSSVVVPVGAATARLAIRKTWIHAAGCQAAGSARLALGKAGVHALAGISDADALDAPGVLMGRRRSRRCQGDRTDGGDGHRGQDKSTHADLLLRAKRCCLVVRHTSPAKVHRHSTFRPAN